jgi:hypothetical protein
VREYVPGTYRDGADIASAPLPVCRLTHLRGRTFERLCWFAANAAQSGRRGSTCAFLAADSDQDRPPKALSGRCRADAGHCYLKQWLAPGSQAGSQESQETNEGTEPLRRPSIATGLPKTGDRQPRNTEGEVILCLSKKSRCSRRPSLVTAKWADETKHKSLFGLYYLRTCRL